MRSCALLSPGASSMRSCRLSAVSSAAAPALACQPLTLLRTGQVTTIAFRPRAPNSRARTATPHPTSASPGSGSGACHGAPQPPADARL
eukprot:41982-Rhodomonas_salina.2